MIDSISRIQSDALRLSPSGRAVRLLSALLLFALAPASATHAEEQPSGKFQVRELAEGEKYVAYQLEFREDMIGKGVPFAIHRALEAAKAAKADVIVMDLHTNGGSLAVLEELNDRILALRIPVIAYVNTKAWSAGSLLAISADKIIMAPVSTIGGAQVITATGQEIGDTVEQKINSMLKSRARGTAKRKNHPVVICEAFIDRDIEIPGLTPKGEVLTLDQEEATTETIYVDAKTSKTVVIPPLSPYIAANVGEILEREGIWPAEVRSYQMTWSEELAKWLLAIRPLLLLIGLGALFIEVKTPGLGIPAAVGVAALALFFWGSYLADLSGMIEVVLFMLGFALLILEVFVIPGFGVAGVTGVLLIVASLILAMVKSPAPELPDSVVNYGMLKQAMWNLILVFVAAIPTVWMLSRILPSVPIFRDLILDPNSAPSAAPSVRVGISVERPPAPESLLGRRGRTLTDLRPAGTALVEGARIDVVTSGDYIDKGATIRVIDIHGSVHTVERAEEEDPKA